jgi:UDP-2,3-diacylglucosamine pyrophosphatase LpxH
MKKFQIFLGLSLFLLMFVIVGARGQSNPQSDFKNCPVRFAIIGDRTGSAVTGIYEGIVAEVERLKPDFVLTVGDMVQGYTADTVTLNKQWDEYKTLISHLTMPIYYTPGNHDITLDTVQEWYLNHFGKRYYSIDIRGIHFIVLDNSRWESSRELPRDQMDWLLEDLKKSQNAAYTFIFYHKPFWFESTAENRTDTLHTLFRKYGVDAVFNGHYHLYYSGKYDGIYYTDVGSSGGEAEVGPTGLQYHFLWVTVDDKGIYMAPIKGGSVLPWEEVAATELKIITVMTDSGINFEKPVSLGENLNLLDSNLIIKITDVHPDLPLNDTLRWDKVAGWSITPEIYPIQIKPGESLTAQFVLHKTGDPYPVPTLSFRFNYAPGKHYIIKKSLLAKRETHCYRAAKPPIIDGNVTESAWQSPNAMLFDYYGDKNKLDSTAFYFSYDKSNLYLAAYCKETRIDSMAAAVTERDGAIYGEDCVGYFFQPDLSKKVVYQIYFNPLGAIFDQRIAADSSGSMVSDRKWNGNYEVKTSKGADFWSIEVKIPLAQLGGKIKAEQNWGLNFRRKERRLSSSADWQIPLDSDPKALGKLIMDR